MWEEWEPKPPREVWEDEEEEWEPVEWLGEGRQVGEGVVRWVREELAMEEPAQPPMKAGQKEERVRWWVVVWEELWVVGWVEAVSAGPKSPVLVEVTVECSSQPAKWRTTAELTRTRKIDREERLISCCADIIQWTGVSGK